jgi:cytidine deaminase
LLIDPVMARLTLPAWTAGAGDAGLFSSAPISLQEKEIQTDYAEWQALVSLARKAAASAYAPYSNFRVGAALMMADEASNRIFTGANVENSSFGLTICAERVAIQSAVAAGFRKLRLIAISCPDAVSQRLEGRSPCGACRQVIREFSDHGTLILLDRNTAEFGADILDIERLLPWGFSLR